jgi:hypothetical protein
MYEQKKQLLKLLKTFSDNGFSEHLVLIGSWAEYMYMVADILPDYEANIRTLDVDFLVKNLRKPNPPVNIISLAKDEGFFIEEDCLTSVTKLLSSDGFEVEFLIAQKGKGEHFALKTNLGVTAQALRHLELLNTNTLTIEYLGIKISIPTPEAFVLHKMIINSERKEKIEKDQLVINRMYKHLNKDKFNELQQTLTKREQRAVKNYLDNIIQPIIDKENEINAVKHLIKKTF